MIEKEIDAQTLLSEYLSNTSPKDWPRKDCCNTSRSFYCPECCKVLIPREDWPDDIRKGKLRLPFDIDIILGVKERRTSSTGVQIAAVSSALASTLFCPNSKFSDGDPESSLSETLESVCSSQIEDKKKPRDENMHSSRSKSVRVFSLEDNNNIPSYDINPTDEKVYLLFPAEDSVSIVTVGKIDRLVVLDIKWTRQNKDSRFTALPTVHLDSPPSKSHFWRWHNSGDGMLSTIEAVYFAAMDVTKNCWTTLERLRLINIMWLFSLQHSIINKRSIAEQRPVPFSEEGKAKARLLRQRHPDRKIKKKLNQKKDNSR